MKSSVVLTVIGPDHPGLVESLANVVASHGGNWEEGRMAHLDGHFAGLLRVGVDDAKREALEAALGALKDLSVTSTPSAAADAAGTGPLYSLDVLGQDHEGIVLELSRALSKHGVNVEELTSHCESAPMSGEMLFKARAQLRIPAEVSPEELREKLEAIGGNLMVDVSLSPLDD